ncbi:Uncharacterised protein [Chlamydia trachomatis]|nr:Uncharacterised protein [Chlamydia trachomatis]
MSKEPKPTQAIRLLLGSAGSLSKSSDNPEQRRFFSNNCPQIPAITTQTTLGRNSVVIIPDVEILSLIQSIVVVTSPKGVQAPPAFTPITHRAPSSSRSSRAFTRRFRIEIIIIMDVRLSKAAERKKERISNTQSSTLLDSTLQQRTTIENPL